MNFNESRELLTSISPKPKGECFTNNNINICYDIQIIIPAYNVERFIESCLNSVKPFLQSRYNVLLQIVDDGSDDKTGGLIDDFINTVENGSVEVIHQESKGLSSARNVALKNIYGEYILFIDSDDFIPADINNDKIVNNAKNVIFFKEIGLLLT